MSEWTKAKSILQRVLDNDIDEHDIRYLVSAVKTSIKALNIAEHLEGITVDVRNKKCKYCGDFKDCEEVNAICDKVDWYQDGYEQAIEDMRGDNE